MTPIKKQVSPSGYFGKTFSAEDSSGERPLKGGIGLEAQPQTRGRKELGTIGCFGHLVAEPNIQVLLTNQHVLIHPKVDLGMARSFVYQPSRSTFYGAILNEIGHSIKGIKDNVTYNNGNEEAEYYVDAAIARLNEGIEGMNVIKDLGPISDIKDISTLDESNSSEYKVWKSGVKTDITEGIIKEFNFIGDELMDDNSGNKKQRRILIKPTDLEKVLTTDWYEIPPGEMQMVKQKFTKYPLVTWEEDGNLMRFTYPYFSQGSDSGSALLNENNEIVGLVVGHEMVGIYVMVDNVKAETDPEAPPRIKAKAGIPTGESTACHIKPVIQTMGITIETGGTTSTAGQHIALPGTAIKNKLGENEVSLEQMLSHFEKIILSTKLGRELYKDFQSIISELIHIVHHTRLGKFTWHKFKGPAFSAGLIRGIQNPGQVFKKEIEGVSVEILLDKLYQVFLELGNSKIQGILDKHRPLILQGIKKNTINEIIESWKNSR